jgi:hypothetical protein
MTLTNYDVKRCLIQFVLCIHVGAIRKKQPNHSFMAPGLIIASCEMAFCR